jgi:hypothetical protein
MMGSEGNPGIIPQAIDDIFEHISEVNCELAVIFTVLVKWKEGIFTSS